jgi:HK97 gp10 family phage protein
MATRNIAGGRSAEVVGLRELSRKLDRLKSAVASQEASAAVGKAAGTGREAIRSSMRGAGWPASLISKAFSTDGVNKRGKIVALFGVNKQSNMVVWNAGPNPKSPRAKVGEGGKVAMSMVSMFEFGTTRMQAKPAVRPAIQGSKSQMVQTTAAEFKAIIIRHAK